MYIALTQLKFYTYDTNILIKHFISDGNNKMPQSKQHKLCLNMPFLIYFVQFCSLHYLDLKSSEDHLSLCPFIFVGIDLNKRLNTVTLEI